MLTRAMTKEIEAKAGCIQEFYDTHEWLRTQPDRLYEQTIRWFRKHGIELPAGVRERTADEFLAILVSCHGLSHLVTDTSKCSECEGSYNTMDMCHDGRCIPCTNKELRQRHKRQILPHYWFNWE